MITAWITRKDGTEYQLNFTTITTALEQCRGTLKIGDRFVIKEGKTKLAHGKIDKGLNDNRVCIKTFLKRNRSY